MQLRAFWLNTLLSVVMQGPQLHTPSFSLQSSTRYHFKKENKSEHGSWRSYKGQLASYCIFVTPHLFLLRMVRPFQKKKKNGSLAIAMLEVKYETKATHFFQSEQFLTNSLRYILTPHNKISVCKMYNIQNSVVFSPA